MQRDGGGNPKTGPETGGSPTTCLCAWLSKSAEPMGLIGRLQQYPLLAPSLLRIYDTFKRRQGPPPPLGVPFTTPERFPGSFLSFPLPQLFLSPPMSNLLFFSIFLPNGFVCLTLHVSLLLYAPPSLSPPPPRQTDRSHIEATSIHPPNTAKSQTLDSSWLYYIKVSHPPF